MPIVSTHADMFRDVLGVLCAPCISSAIPSLHGGGGLLRAFQRRKVNHCFFHSRPRLLLGGAGAPHAHPSIFLWGLSVWKELAVAQHCTQLPPMISLEPCLVLPPSSTDTGCQGHRNISPQTSHLFSGIYGAMLLRYLYEKHSLPGAHLLLVVL